MSVRRRDLIRYLGGVEMRQRAVQFTNSLSASQTDEFFRGLRKRVYRYVTAVYNREYHAVSVEQRHTD